MTCEICRSQLVDRLAGALPSPALEAVEDHLASCAACAAEAAELDAAWQALGALPAEEPAPAVRHRFDAFLAAAEAQASRPRPALADRLAFLWPRQPAFQAALVALALVGGYALGIGGRRGEIGELRSEVRTLHHMVALSLLDRDSASERLRGVSYSQSAAGTDPAVVAALLDAVRQDPSVNVRLAAIDALAPRAGAPTVRRDLLTALAEESSPLVQVAIGEAVLSGDGAAARRELAAALDSPRLDPKVKDYLARRLREEA